MPSAAGAAVLLAACSAGQPAQPHPAGRPARSGSASAPAAAAPLPGQSPASTGLLPAPAGVTDRLIVPAARWRAGTPLRVTLLVTYRGPRPLNLNRGCRPQWTVVPANHRFPPDVAFASVCSARPFLIRPGLNRLRTTVLTTYRSCTMTKGQATRQLPRCGPDHRGPPALPPGRYRLVLVGSGLPLPAPAPVPATLSPPCPPGARCPVLVPPAPR
jgi:hypothetical protein